MPYGHTPERTLFRGLGVFVGDWTLDAAQNVCSSGDLDARDIPDLLAPLVEKSLVILDMTSSRYRFLETVREYALERLREADEEPAFRSRHVDYFTHEAEAADPVLTGGDMAVIVLTRESHNLISAIRWCESAPGEIPRGLRLIGASRWVWFSLCEPEPIHSIARRFLARPEAAPRTNQRLASLLLMVQTGFDTNDNLREPWLLSTPRI